MNADPRVREFVPSVLTRENSQASPAATVGKIWDAYFILVLVVSSYLLNANLYFVVIAKFHRKQAGFGEFRFTLNSVTETLQPLRWRAI